MLELLVLVDDLFNLGRVELQTLSAELNCLKARLRDGCLGATFENAFPERHVSTFEQVQWPATVGRHGALSVILDLSL